MAIRNFGTTLNYMEDDLGIHTRMSIFQYQRPRPNSRILRVPIGTIVLPYPDHIPPDSYSMSIGGVDLGAIGNATSMAETRTGISNINATLSERMKSSGMTSDIFNMTAAALAVAPGLADLFGKNASGLAISETAQATTGFTRNPHTALLFNNVDLRTFTITWKLSPRSQKQSQSLNLIINRIKRAMHPDLAVSGFALDYPNLVKIDFNNDKEGITQIDYAFIEDFVIDGTPNGHVFYREGYPSIVTLTMKVKEIRIKTTEDFEDLDRLAYNDAAAK